MDGRLTLGPGWPIGPSIPGSPWEEIHKQIISLYRTAWKCAHREYINNKWSVNHVQHWSEHHWEQLDIIEIRDTATRIVEQFHYIQGFYI